ncbi:murein L,D-transpeptidase [Acuticoccus sediminis]|uniref:Murein L,D-transpeptidase n=1 Tax=Acuticoccus sediminis TaxID=2184697 RepID=A0A8B2NP93_9HYPH|nr:L,D-transpeptidase family protein [Acuticoccus sediminis]RAH98740.1 murein L,D-transpeptidase [Acuticoccus sediminis]
MMALSGPASAQDFGQSPLAALQDYKHQAEWSERFDATLPEVNAVNSQLPTLSPQALGRMQLVIEQYRTIAASGGWPEVNSPKQALRLGTSDKNVPVLRQRLIITGDLQERGGRQDVYDSYVATAVRRFQLRHGLPATGILDAPTLIAMNIPAHVRVRQLESNFNRIQDLSKGLSDRYVLVNIPAAEIEAVENGRVRSRHTAVVGKVDRPSPLLTSRIHEINFNPYWTVPVSIVRRDLIPKMQQDPSYLANQKIRIYKWGNESREYSYNEIDWNTDEATQYMFRQEPGELNSLGTVKINFHNTHQVYLHDTPQKGLFGEGARFHSSGCVRVQNVRELITWLLAPNGWDRAQVDQVIRTGERLDVPLKLQTQIMFAYITAWVNADGVVHFRDDIYNRDGTETVAYSGGTTVR